MVSETGDASMLLENLINVHTNINMSNLILVLKEILNTSENNAVRIASLEQSFVTQSELRKQLSLMKDDVKLTFGDSLKESHIALVDSVRKDIQMSVKQVVDREVSSITADLIEHKTRYHEKMRELDSIIMDNLKTTIDLTNKGDRKVTSVQQLVDRLEFRTIKMEDSIREYSDNFKKLQSRISRINQSLNKATGTTLPIDNEIDVDEYVEEKKKSETPLSSEKKKNKKKPSSRDLHAESESPTPTVNNSNNETARLEVPYKEREEEKQGYHESSMEFLHTLESSESHHSLSDLSAPMRLQMGDLTLTKIQTKVNELKDYVDTLKDTLQHRIAGVKLDLRDELTLNIHTTRKELEDKITPKMEKKDVYHLLGFKANIKELDKIKSDYEFIMSMYAKLDKEVQHFKENPVNLSMSSSNSSPTRRQSIPLGISTASNIANSIVREDHRRSPQVRKSKSTQDDPLNIINRGTSPPKERMPHIFGNNTFGHKAPKPKKSATDVNNSGNRPLSNQTLNALSILDKVTQQRSASAMDHVKQEDPEAEVNLIGSDAKIYRFGNAEKKVLRSASPTQLSDSEDEWNVRTSVVGRSMSTRNQKNSPPYALSRLRNEVRELSGSVDLISLVK